VSALDDDAQAAGVPVEDVREWLRGEIDRRKNAPEMRQSYPPPSGFQSPYSGNRGSARNTPENAETPHGRGVLA
jgi:hypothetical protein